MGLNALLRAAEGEKKNISQASRKKEAPVQVQEVKQPEAEQTVPEQDHPPLPLLDEGEHDAYGNGADRPQADTGIPVKHEKRQKTAAGPEKRKRGRPSFKEKGMTVRKQYTLTLEEEVYGTILNKANAEKISFAKYMERAALEYMERHGNR